MAQGAHKITADFEAELCRYTGAPYAIAVDNCSNALFLALYYEIVVRHRAGMINPLTDEFGSVLIDCPAHTYMSVPNAIIHADGKPNFFYTHNSPFLTGAYRLNPTNVVDSALSFTYCMYLLGTHMCLSFTGPYKHLKLGKGGAILTDNKVAAAWFKLARFSGRSECSYFNDNFDHPVTNPYIDPCFPGVIGWNYYMMPEIAAKGLLLMGQFYDQDGTPKYNPDLTMRYPDLSQYKLWQVTL